MPKHPDLRLLLATLVFTGGTASCAPSDNAPPTDEEAPVSSLDTILQDAPGNEALEPEGKADAVYPAQFDLFADQTPVRNQSGRGVCSIFAAVALVENLYKHAGVLEAPDFSEQWLQWSVKTEVGAFSYTEGSSANRNLEAVRRFGIPLETAWPYETSPWTSANDPRCVGEENLPVVCYTNGEPSEAARMSTLYKIPGARYLNSAPRSIKAYMTTNRVGVIVGGSFYYQSWNHGRSTLPTNAEYFRQGYVLAPNDADREASEAKPAGHEFLLVGWDDTLEVQSLDEQGKPMVDANGNPVMQRGFFLFKNSWGTTRFGTANRFGAGYGWIAYDYVRELSAYTGEVPTAAPPSEICDDGRDNDRDRATDCSDSDCAGSPACGVTPPTGTTTDTNSSRRNIPDNNEAGVTSSISVATGGRIATLSVTVNITHPFRGDLTVTLQHPSGQSFTLSENDGGYADNLNETFSVTAFNGLDASGDWKLVVVDNLHSDTGRIESWSLTINRAP